MSTPREPNVPKYPPVLSVLVDEAQLAAVSEQLTKTAALAPAVADQLVTVGVIAKSLSSVPSLKELEASFSTWGLERLHRYWAQNAPDNWAQLEDEWLDIFDVIESTGLCVLWAPDEAVMREMITTTDPEGCLVANRDKVLAGLETALEHAQGVPVAGHADACEFAAEAIASARDGRATAAQALAACGFATLINITHGLPFKEARDKFHVEIGDTTIGTMKASALQFCSHKALLWYPPKGPPPREYNRHATHHGARANFTAANSISSLLLLVAWLRELKWIEEHDPTGLSAFVPA